MLYSGDTIKGIKLKHVLYFTSFNCKHLKLLRMHLSVYTLDSSLVNRSKERSTHGYMEAETASVPGWSAMMALMRMMMTVMGWWDDDEWCFSNFSSLNILLPSPPPPGTSHLLLLPLLCPLSFLPLLLSRMVMAMMNAMMMRMKVTRMVGWGASARYSQSRPQFCMKSEFQYWLEDSKLYLNILVVTHHCLQVLHIQW